MTDAKKTWQMIYSERQSLADTLEGLPIEDWSKDSLCQGWTIQLALAHVVAGAEQTPAQFMSAMAANGFRFNVMIDRAAHRIGTAEPADLIARLHARTTTTNHPPGPVSAMLGEAVVHGEDIRRALGLSTTPASDATSACLNMYKGANFPVGTKSRIKGLQLVATDNDWTHGDGPRVVGPAVSLLMAMTGRKANYDDLTGKGAEILRARL